MSSLDVATVIAEFLANPSCNSLELPPMTTGQRKHTKNFVEQHPELRCESYGFGAERQLHIFQERTAINEACNLPAHGVTLKNTFIDGWNDAEPEPVVFRSLQATLSKDNIKLFYGAQHAASQRVGSPDSTSASGVASTKTPNSGSLVSSRNGSPTSNSRKMPAVQDMPQVRVRNTFIHVGDSTMDGRVVQSMPHGMFGQRVAEEVRQKAADTEAFDADDDAEPTPERHPTAAWLSVGFSVVVEGLVRHPGFNGLSAVVQGWDEASGRYNILIGSTEGRGCQQAKIKAKNLRLLLPCP